MRILAAMALCLFGFSGGGVRAQDADGLNLYVFGNSLIHHLSETDETAVPHWLAQLAQADDRAIAVDGQWGFLRDFAKNQTPQANWRFNQVDRAWGRQYRNFRDVPWDVVMINPANFIQYKNASEAYDGENPDNSSPLSATLAVIDRIAPTAQPERFVIYEGWADMSSFGRFPPSGRKFSKYLAFNAGDYDAWYLDYVTQLRDARPDVQIDLIPVAKVISELVDGGVLFDMTPEDLYTDDAPHGTPTLYLLAAAITYVGLFEAELPTEIDLPETIHEDVRIYWEAVREDIHRLVLEPIEAAAALAPQQETEVAEGQPFPTPEGSLGNGAAAGQGLADPALAMGLAAISDWGTQHPFINRMKTARPWIGHLPDQQWGGMGAEDLQDAGLMDEEGWVWGLPPDIKSIEALLLTDQPAEAIKMAGRFRVRWQGSGTVELTGRAGVTSVADQEIWFDYVPGEGPVGIRIDATDPDRIGDYVHDISVVAERHIPLFEAGAVFNPDWLRVVADLRVVRFMDWMQTNGSDHITWDGRPQVSDFTYGWRGVPVEVMVQLANEIGADPWFNMPHLADDAYMRSFAEAVRDLLDPNLVAHVEYSNELWNWGFQQAQWALKKAEERWGQVENGHVQFAGMRAAEMGRIWGDVFGAEADARLMRVVATHADWPGLEQGLLQAPKAQEDGAPPPVTAFDGYAMTGYFGVGLGMERGAAEVKKWLAEARETAMTAGAAKGLQRAALTAYTDARQYDGMHAKVAQALRRGSIKELREKTMPYQAKVARDNELALLMYEGGSHVTGVGELANDTDLAAYFEAFSTSPELGEIYVELLEDWRGLGARSFNAFNDVGKPSKWGSWGHLRHLWDTTPRHTALVDYNEDGSHWIELRAKDAFLHGGVFYGTEGPDRLAGTVKRDTLVGGGGNDVLIASGPADRLHGGAGADQAILPGTRSDYSFERDGTRIRATATGRSYLLTGIDAVSFDAAPTVVIPIAGLL
ncbi:MAG: calcium-binding protein [Shimia sp.]|uniref:calcium-binding protein n=1 Tax=Shimia sp. TaxID=1954381 RepID=UPI0040584477